MPGPVAAPTYGERLYFGSVVNQWWRNARMAGPVMTLHVHHFWRPSTPENNFLSPSLVEPVADARLCCARAPAHRHVAPRRPISGLFTWRRLRCPKGSCIGERGEGRWWVRSPANSRTSFSEGQKDYRTIVAQFRVQRPRDGTSGGHCHRNKVPIVR